MTDRKPSLASGPDAVRAAFTRAGAAHEPRLDGLIASVPAMMTEAARRRRLAQTPAARIWFAAGSWLPRLAATAALLVVLAILWPSRRGESASTGTDATSAIDSWLVTGSASSAVQDPVLDALVR